MDRLRKSKMCDISSSFDYVHKYDKVANLSEYKSKTFLFFFVVIENRRFKSYVKFTHAVFFRIISLAYMTKLGLKLFKITKKL